MVYRPLKHLATLCLMSIASLHGQAADAHGLLVVIKADDLVYRKDGSVFGAGWNRFIEIADEQEIKVSIGIITNSLDYGTDAYFSKIRRLHDSGQVEFWNHGYTHKRDVETGHSEFKGASFDAQLATLTRGQTLAKEKLGFEFTSFGSPYNHKDPNTPRALREVPELTSWMYGDEQAELLPGQVVLGRSIHLEQPVHHPNFEAFKRDFEANPDRPYYILQAHPGGWDTERFEQFVQVVKYLQEKNAIFMTPTELRDRLLEEN